MKNHRFFTATLLSSDNEYITYPIKVRVEVLEFQVDGEFNPYRVIVKGEGFGSWVRARNAKFADDIEPIERPADSCARLLTDQDRAKLEAERKRRDEFIKATCPIVPPETAKMKLYTFGGPDHYTDFHHHNMLHND